MRSNADNSRAAAADLSRYIGQKSAKRSARGYQRSKKAAVKSEGREYFWGKVPPYRIEQCTGRGYGILARLLPGKEISEQVGDEKHTLCIPDSTVTPLGIKLIHSVEIQKLDPGDTVQLFARHYPIKFTDDALGASVTVMHRVCKQSAARVDKTVINAPCVNSYRAQLSPACGAYCIFAFGKQPQNIPCKSAVQHLRLIRKTVYLTKRKLFSVKAAHDSASA